MSAFDQLTTQALRNPAGAAADTLSLVVKIFIFILILIYIFFALRVWVQVRRVTHWLVLLRGHRFEAWALLHLGLAIVGLGVAFLVL